RALAIAQSEPQPDLILLDIMMPGMDGYEVCRRLKADSKTRDIPVIFVTARTQVEDEIQGLEMGAVDYIHKPFSPPVVLARVRTHLALRDAKAALQLSNNLLNEERHTIETIIQKMRDTQAFDAVRLRYLIASLENTNGDILLSNQCPDGRQLVLLGDFTGHGLPAAIAGPLVAHIFNEAAAQDEAVLTTLDKINQVLCRNLPVNIFMATGLLELSPDRKTVTTLNAGLPDGQIIRQGRLQASISSTLPPLGILDVPLTSTDFISRSVEPEDRIFLYSDGLIEEKNHDGELYGMTRLSETLVTLNHEPLETLLDPIKAFTGQAEFSDDITLVELTIESDG
ncbi:MAG: SpoIIE family protein phosphatase, partial [Magnetococcales bacterium]|nr:SpoIIE family protein phosphatase [Magnetococcales bacterium]